MIFFLFISWYKPHEHEFIEIVQWKYRFLTKIQKEEKYFYTNKCILRHYYVVASPSHEYDTKLINRRIITEIFNKIGLG